MSVYDLQQLIIARQNPTCVGLDPRPEYIPDFLLKKYTIKYGETIFAIAEAYKEFNFKLIDALEDIIPCVKLQSACYEELGWNGMRIMEETAKYAAQKGLFVIADVKRGDIGSTQDAYRNAFLGHITCFERKMRPFEGFHAMTVSSYMGSDTMKPYAEYCKKSRKMVFFLAKTSNPSSSEIQDIVVDGEPIYSRVCGMVDDMFAPTIEETFGYLEAGVVVGATHPEQLKELRAKYPRLFFLVPGYGAQGATAEDIKHAFDAKGRGAVVNSSRGIICAWKSDSPDAYPMAFAQAARDAAIKMRNEICGVVNFGQSR